MIKIFYFDRGLYPHVALECTRLEQRLYMSYSDSNHKSFCLQTLEEDIELYGRPIEVISIMTQEDDVSVPDPLQSGGTKNIYHAPSESQLLNFWHNFEKVDTGFSLAFNNCSDFVFKALQAAFNHVIYVDIGNYRPAFGIKTPGFIVTTANDLKRRVDEHIHLSMLEIKPTPLSESEERRQYREAQNYYSGPNEFYFHQSAKISRTVALKQKAALQSNRKTTMSSHFAMLHG